MDINQLQSTAHAMVAPGKGILAADESTGTIKRRFDAINVECTEQNRRNYREMLFRTNGTNEFISGVILYDETLRQKGADGTSLVKVLQDQGIIPGIKVDMSTNPLSNAPGELITDGLDGLRARLQEYYELGARFAKWRAVITIGHGLPSQYCIDANAHLLARYAGLCQEANLVPMVEPEVLMDGMHTIGKCYEATEATLRKVYHELGQQRVDLTGTILKPNMVLSGKEASNRASAAEVAEKTIACFRNTVPAAVPGIAFLSGGQGDEEATSNLDTINRLASKVGVPWQLSFSFGRGLQASPLAAWGGDDSKFEEAKQAYYHRARVMSAARMGQYTSDMERSEAAD